MNSKNPQNIMVSEVRKIDPEQVEIVGETPPGGAQGPQGFQGFGSFQKNIHWVSSGPGLLLAPVVLGVGLILFLFLILPLMVFALLFGKKFVFFGKGSR